MSGFLASLLGDRSPDSLVPGPGGDRLVELRVGDLSAGSTSNWRARSGSSPAGLAAGLGAGSHGSVGQRVMSRSLFGSSLRCRLWRVDVVVVTIAEQHQVCFRGRSDRGGASSGCGGHHTMRLCGRSRGIGSRHRGRRRHGTDPSARCVSPGRSSRWCHRRVVHGGSHSRTAPCRLSPRRPRRDRWSTPTAWSPTCRPRPSIRRAGVGGVYPLGCGWR